MATQQSWTVRNEILSSFQNLENALANYKSTFERLKEIKEEILDDAGKKADLKLLLDQDPDISIAEVVSKYTQAKAIYDWITENV